MARSPPSASPRGITVTKRMAKTTTKKTKAKKASRKSSKKSTAKRSSASEGIGKILVIVESPAKAKTINRYLGDAYIVKASMGHVRDLPKKNIGVDLENRFNPTYEPLTGRKDVLSDLKRFAKACGKVFLATDLDREGEAIAWHLAESLPLPPEAFQRVVFNEITASAITQAFEHARTIDMSKVNAQQARRILDRIVGYQVSPLLWKKVARGLSAGRVQSVAVRLIVERERQIDAFIPEEYWRIGAIFTPDCPAAGALGKDWAELLDQTDAKGNGPTREVRQAFLTERGAFQAELVRWKDAKFNVNNADNAVEIAQALGLTIDNVERGENERGKGPAANPVKISAHLGEGCPPFEVTALNQKDRKSNPPAPFITSTMQQTAAVQLRFSASRTMRIAQQLYEGIDIPGEGTVGLITYMRTDSRHLAGEAIANCRSMISDRLGPEYLPDKPNVYSSGKRAQEAHEAVRPTDASRLPDYIKSALTAEQYSLYNLIWKRFVSCQMNPAIWSVTEATISVQTPRGEAQFKALGRKLKFDGFMKVAGLPRGGDQILPAIKTDQQVAPVEISPIQHFTQPPPRFTEASLVKALEADGIGRPSTYASIIKTIQDRKYVELLERSFHPTDMGTVVTDKLVKHLPKVFDVHFTARLEDQLDRVEEGQVDWVTVLDEFYGPFSENLKRASEEMVHAKAEETPSDYVCENCSKPMVYKFSRNGRYLACTGYPDCKTTHPVDKEGKKIEKVVVDVACPKCGKAMVLRRGRFGPFLSCAQYPECDGVVNIDKKGFVKHPSPPPLEIDLQCAKCESPLYLRRGARGPWLACSKYPKCRGRLGWKTLSDEKRDELELALLNHEKENPQPTICTLDGTEIGSEHTPLPAPAETDGEKDS